MYDINFFIKTIKQLNNLKIKDLEVNSNIISNYLK